MSFLCIMLLGVFPKLRHSVDHSVVRSAGRYLFFLSTSAIFLLVRQQVKSVWSRLLFAPTVSKVYRPAGELPQLCGVGTALVLWCTVSSLSKTQQLASILLYPLHSCSLGVWICFGRSTPFGVSLLFPFCSYFWQ